MAGISIEVDIEGVLPSAMLAELASRADDTLELMTDIGSVLESSMRERVELTKTAPDGTPWPPNRAGTPTLFRSGDHLFGSLAFFAEPGRVEAGSWWQYAHVHQDGAVITPKSAARLHFMLGGRSVFARKVTIPARPFAGISAEDESEITRVTTDWMSGLISGLPGAPL